MRARAGRNIGLDSIDACVSEVAPASIRVFLSSGQVFVPGMTMRFRRLRLTIARVMGTVAFTAVALSCLVEVHRIRRAQAFYLQEASKYARWEKSENDTRSRHLSNAIILKKLMEYQAEADEEERVQDHFFARSRAPDRLTGSKRERYNRSLESGRESLVIANAALIRAQRFHKLSSRYEQAGSCLWLPFWPNPLRVAKCGCCP